MATAYKTEVLKDLQSAIRLLKSCASHPVDYEILHLVVRAEYRVEMAEFFGFPDLPLTPTQLKDYRKTELFEYKEDGHDYLTDRKVVIVPEGSKGTPKEEYLEWRASAKKSKSVSVIGVA
jgi:hypothetical protein